MLLLAWRNLWRNRRRSLITLAYNLKRVLNLVAFQKLMQAVS